MIDVIVDAMMRPGHPFMDYDRAVLHATVAAQFESGRYVLLQDGMGGLQGFLSWLCTDELGAALVQAYGLDDLAYLSLPIAMEGDRLLVVICVCADGAPPETLFRMLAAAKAANPETSYMVSIIGRSGKWVARRLKW